MQRQIHQCCREVVSYGLTVLVALLAATAAKPAWSQYQRRGPAKTEVLKSQPGVIEAVGPGMLKVTLGGDPWLVAPAPNAEVTVEGTAGREMLSEGQYVVADITLDDSGKSTAPVTSLTFAGGGPAGVMGNLVAGSPPPRPGGKRPAGAYRIAGTIESAEGESVTVKVGPRETIAITVPEDAKLLATSPLFASSGDQVVLSGHYQVPGRLQATKVIIKLANPVTPPPKPDKPARP